MSEQARPNINAETWQRSIEHGSHGLRGTAVGAQAGARQLGVGVFELDPGRRNLPYHAHHGIEELIIVLSGTPTLRSPAGERELAEGEVVACLSGPSGAHQLINRSQAVARFLVVSTRNQADLVEYPDSGKISAQGGERGSPEAVSYMLSTEHQLGYFEGEPD